MEDKKFLLWYSDARASAGHPLSLMSPCCVPWGSAVPFFLPVCWILFCVHRNHLCSQREWGHHGKPKKLHCARWWCRGEPTWVLLKGPVDVGRGQCVVTAPAHPPWSWLLSLQLFVPLGSEGFHPLLLTSLLPARHISSHWLPHSWQLEPFQSLPGGSSLAFPAPLPASRGWD